MIPERYAAHTYALMRIVFGLMFLTYGLAKYGFTGGPSVPMASLLGVAGVIELVVGVLVTVGLMTRPAAFIASGEMAVAYFLNHQPNGALPIQNNGIPAVLFCFAFLYMAARGSGIMSIDAGRVRSR